MEVQKIEEMSIQNAIAISKLTEVSIQTSKDVDKLIKHFDASKPMKDHINRIDDDVKELKDGLDDHREATGRKLRVLDPVFTILRYPRMAAVAFLGIIMLAYAPVRDVVGVGVLKLVGM